MTTSLLSRWSGCDEVVLKQTRRFSPWSMTVSRSRWSSYLAASCSAISSSVCVTSLGNCVSSSFPHNCRRRVATSLAMPENFSSAYRYDVNNPCIWVQLLREGVSGGGVSPQRVCSRQNEATCRDNGHRDGLTQKLSIVDERSMGRSPKRRTGAEPLTGVKRSLLWDNCQGQGWTQNCR